MERADETKEITLTSDDLTILKIAMDDAILDKRFAATLNDEWAQEQEQRMALRDRLYTLGVFAQGPFTVVMRVEEAPLDTSFHAGVSIEPLFDGTTRIVAYAQGGALLSEEIVSDTEAVERLERQRKE